ncbi:FAD-dependent oxidoreductase [Bradyrhizobium sp. CCBAU 25338]|uniref:NAD(P)/FAD-dependent oxidoreductase n=1 Tax=Bradyrhizobium sp. CCBAU 25338 TaxID=1641877 RepID=UPI002302EE71|nr:FAD-dependent oxidoreductase [Bradyrhizobium sp. CCBAU 25338]
MQRFDVIVIGSGAFGSSTAFHLAKQGKSVALLDKADIASQTSPRAAGLTGHLRQTEAMTRLSTEALRKIERFSDETGEPIEFYQPGSMSCARRLEDVAVIRERVALGQRLGLSAELISPEEARAKNPFLETKGILAVSYMKRDAYLEPAQLPLGYARAAEKLGAVLMPNTRVLEIVVENGSATRVVTKSRRIRRRCDRGCSWRMGSSRCGSGRCAGPRRANAPSTDDHDASCGGEVQPADDTNS